MKKIPFLLLFWALTMALVMGCEYDAEKYSTKVPADFYYVNNSDHKMDMLFFPEGIRSSGYDTLIDKTTIHLRPGESVLVKTDDPVDGNDPIFGQFVVIYDDTEFFSYFSELRRSLIWSVGGPGWDRRIPLYPISYERLYGTDEFGHQTLEFIFTNEHYDMMKEGKDNVNDTIITDEHGERFFKGWNLYKDLPGVDIDGVLWAPVDYGEKNYGNNEGYATHHEAMHGCPITWRLPTAEEYKALSTNHSVWNVRFSDDNGMRFSGLKEYSADSTSLLLTPDADSGVYREGNFWTSTKVSEGEALVFSFNNNNKVSFKSAGTSKRYRVRCVKTEKRKYI